MLTAPSERGIEGAWLPWAGNFGCQFLRLAEMAGKDVSCVPVPFVQGFVLARLTCGLRVLSMARSGEAGWAEVEGCGPAE